MKKLILTIGTMFVFLAILGCQNTEISTEKTTITQTVPKFSAEEFFETTSYGLPSGVGYAFSPKSGDLLVTSDQSGIFNSYRLNIETRELEALTNSISKPISSVSWFPNDERFLYTSDGGGDELNHLYVSEIDGSVRDITPGENVKAAFAGWSKGGDFLFVLTNERDANMFDVYKYDSKTYEGEMIYKNDGKQIDAVSSDGRYIALRESRSASDSNIYLVDLKANDVVPKLITKHDGNIAYNAYEFSADGRFLYFSTNEFGEFTQAHKYNLSNGKKSELLSADWDVSFVFDSPTGKYRVSAINADGSNELKILDSQSNTEIILKNLPDGDVRNVRFSSDEKRIAFIMNGDRAPSNIHVASLESRKQKALTSALNPEMTEDMLVEGQVIRYNSYDGLEVPGILYKPHGASAANPVPGLILVHGGPGGQNRKGYIAFVQHLVNHGYGVYAMNNRGSSGYGKTFFHMDDKKHGDVDLKDVIASKDFMAEMDWVDGNKMGVIGSSYGGYMVAAALAFEPNEFDVGINIFGVTNWERTLNSIPPWWGSFRDALYDEMGDPKTDGARHRAISPLFHADNIIKPLLVVQGANDPRVLQIESDELVKAVEANGVPVEYIVFADEGHGFNNKDNRIEASNAYVNFLDNYLKKPSECTGVC